MDFDAEDFEDPERSYRRGFTQGAWEVIDAVRGKLPQEDQDRLDRWFERGAQKWRAAAYFGESARRPGRHITFDILPPKIGWPF